MSLSLACFVSSPIVHNFFFLGSTCLLNKPKTKAQAWIIYKQMNMNELFIKLNPVIHERLGSFTAYLS